MELLRVIVIDITLLLFPLLLYFIYHCYNSVRYKEYNNLVFNLSVLTSLYLCLRFGYSLDNKLVLMFLNIPVIVAYLKKQPYSALVLSICIILFCNTYYDINLYLFILKYFIYFLIYLYFIKYKKNNYGIPFISSVAVFQGFFLSFEYFSSQSINPKFILNLFVIVLVFYVLTFWILYLFIIADRTANLYNVALEYEKDKKIKDSLFKLTHEIKNPIAVCRGYLQMLDINNKEKLNKYIPIISQEIERCLDTIKDFTDYSKIKINKEPVDINYLLDDTYDSIKLILDNKNIKLNYESSEDEIIIMGDFSRLKQVIINIIKNSMESIEDNGNININNHVKKGYFYLKISDDGCGMSKEVLEKISDMFYSTKPNGNGLGVPLCFEIIKAHNGEIKYFSKEGEGTTVTIKLKIEKYHI